MAIVFPASPSVNDTFTEGSITYKWDGDKWIGLGVTPADRLVEGSNKLEIDANNDLLWDGGRVGFGGNGIGSGLGVYLQRSSPATTHFYEASDGTKKMISGVDSTNDYVKIGSLSNHRVGLVANNGEKLSILPSGNVGINITTPGTLLELKGESGKEADVTFNRQPAQGTNDGVIGQLLFENATDSVAQISVKRESAADDAYIQFATQTTGGSFGERLRITSAGDVGINKTAPADRLHVGGKIRFGNNNTYYGVIEHEEGVTGANIYTSADSGGHIFKKSSTTQLTIDTSGNANIADGNLIVASGHGIDFSSNDNAAGMTSELLDDYEEGTFEPTFRAASGDFDTVVYHPDTGGRYVKIGNYVWVTGCVRVAGPTITIGSPSNSDTLCIGNLPFNNNARTNGDNADSHGVCRVPVWNGSQAPHFIQARQNVNFCNLYYMASLTGTSATNNVSHLTNQSMVQFTFSYTSN